MNRIRSSLFILFMILCAVVYSQENVPARDINRGALYVLGAEDELLIPVNVWGFVARPGQYWVPNNTDLLSLISFAGGPTENGKISKIRVVRGDQESPPFNVDIAKYLRTGDWRLIPELKPRDTVVVSGTTFYWISKFFEFVSRLAVFAQIFYFIALGQNILSGD